MENDTEIIQSKLKGIAEKLEDLRNHPERRTRKDIGREIGVLEGRQRVLVEAAYYLDRANLLRSVREGFKQKGVEPPKGIKLNPEQQEIFLLIMKKHK